MEISLLAIGDRTENYTFRLFKAILENQGHRVNLIYLNIGRMYSNITLNEDLEEQLLSIIKFSNIIGMGTVEFSSEITISLNFTAEHAETAEASENSARIETLLKLCVLCALRGDKSLDF